ncbi:O-antigen ligase family protein [Pseudoroseicyclus aestuarii]|nr:O-antigen ligase family protein [Pseudoroseicyclus aestuarii]
MQPGLRRAGVVESPARGALLLFLLTIIMPISMELGGLRLSPTRLFLLVSIIPFAAQIVSGRVGRFTWTDKFFLLHGIWIFLALIMVHGTSRIPFAGITAVELVGGYFVGRVMIRNAQDYRYVLGFMLIAIICLLPVAIYENFTGTLVIPDLLRPIFDTPSRGDSAYGRMGLERVYVVFDHPILWGLFCSLTLSNFVMAVRKNPVLIVVAIGFSLYTTMLALSSAPLLACALQLGMLSWGWIMRGRWRLLLILMVVGYVTVDLLSNRTPVTIIIESLTFNPMSGWVRIAIFDAGWAAVRGSPFFGIGFNDWPRPGWVTSSVDNFWLLTSMRYGMVGVGFLIAAFVFHLWTLGQAKIADPEVQALRVGHAAALAGTAFTMVTVHIWGNVSIFVMFYLGAGSWMYAYDQSGPQQGPEPDGTAPPAGGSPYSRFAPQRQRGPAAGARSVMRRRDEGGRA